MTSLMKKHDYLVEQMKKKKQENLEKRMTSLMKKHDYLVEQMKKNFTQTLRLPLHCFQ